MQTAGKERLHFIFTEHGFTTDRTHQYVDSEIDLAAKIYAEDPVKALYDAGFDARPDYFDAAGVFLYSAADVFLREITAAPELELSRENTVVEVKDEQIEYLLSTLPFAVGAEFVDKKWLLDLFEKLNGVFRNEISSFDGTVKMYLAGKSQRLHVAERIFFHLVENKDDPEFPFAFIATYATRGANGAIKHMPLKYALTEYNAEREKLLELLSCLNKAADVSQLISEFVTSGEMFHPLRLTSDEAYKLLCDAQAVEDAGIVFRIPNWWKKKYNSLNLSVTIGEDRPAFLGMDSILGMTPSLTFCGEKLTEDEITDLLAQTDGLAMLKGRWIAVDKGRLKELLAVMRDYCGDVTLMQALRMDLSVCDERIADVGTVVTNGKWLGELLDKLRSPKKLRSAMVPRSLNAQLRPYQKDGYTWLDKMSELGFGCCLADDMGLGKTVQMLAYLERLRHRKPDAHILLIVPASLIGNWQREKEKFAPEMPCAVMHGVSAKKLSEINESELSFLNITTYGMAARTERFAELHWDCVVCDEAQAIKNPLSKQTRAVKSLSADMRIAMTGTPIENDLTNLWSLFDFLNKGLLGSSGEFRDFCSQLEEHPEGYAKLKTMIAPFLLRRLKTDKSIIRDLPDKLEQVDTVELSKKQIVLYRKHLAELAAKIEGSSDLERRGLILASLMKLKQICNHPDQFLGTDGYSPEDSGKFVMLRDICETIYEKRERVLVFTQFKEIIPYLDRYLESVFHCRGLVLHGGTPVAERAKLVESFQSDEYVPYMVLSVKAGGTGLNLTNASHVIHFDRWWNPAVENQATDRAYRIGQKKNVIVHKLVCRGTVEERIDALIESKKELAENVIGAGAEKLLTDMSNSELMSFLRLELK